MPLRACGVRVGFSLTKWYFDVVTDDGRLAIAYWAEVRWNRLRQPFCALLLSPGAARAGEWLFSGRRVPAPASDAGGLRWNAEPLALTIDFIRREPAFQQRLLETKTGVLDWCCEIPRADVRLRAGETTLEGVGYAERLELGVLPWRIPADEIRWGRFLSSRTSVVWIDWRGDAPQHFVFHDGRLTRPASISDEQIQFGNGWQLALHKSRIVTDEALGGLLRPLERLRSLVAPIARVHQTRWLSRGELYEAAAITERGWSLHEMVSRR